MRSLGLWSLIAFMGLNLVFGHHWVHVPALLQHYEEHQAMDGDDLAFFDFLDLHYADTDHTRSEGSDQDLPFKHDHKEHIGVDHVLWSPFVVAHHQFHPIEKATTLYDPDGLLDGHRQANLQPPKQA